MPHYTSVFKLAEEHPLDSDPVHISFDFTARFVFFNDSFEGSSNKLIEFQGDDRDFSIVVYANDGRLPIVAGGVKDMQIAGLYRLKGVGRWKTLVGRQEKISVLVANCPGPVFTLTLIDERPSLLKSTQSYTDLQQEIRILRECVERTSRHTSPEQHRRRIEDAKERLRRHLQIIENNQEKEEVKLTLYVARLTSAEDELEERREEIVREVGGGRGPVTPPRRASRASSRGRSDSPSPSPLFRLGQGGSSRLG